MTDRSSRLRLSPAAARVARPALGAVAMLLVSPSLSCAATVRTANPSNFGHVFRTAHGGDVIELESGDYGTFHGARKSKLVTIRPRPGASASMGIEFDGARNLRVDGLTIAGAYIGGGARNVTIAHSRFTETALIRTSGAVGANIVLDHDRFDGLNLPPRSYNGRLSVIGSNESRPVGVQIKNSHFGNGGCSDGVFVGGTPYGLQIGPGNVFSGVQQNSCETHVDSIQLYGSSHTRIVGNYFHDDSTIIMAPDDGDHEYIADNVMVGWNYRPAIQMGSHDGTQFVHNTVVNADVHMDSKPTNGPSRNGVLRDNLMDGGAFGTTGGNGCTGCELSYNLFASRHAADGLHASVGRPRFVGGAHPTSYAGFALAPGSAGRGSASDGGDRGARVARMGGAGAPGHGDRPRRRHRPRLRVAVHHHVSWGKLRRGIRVRVTAHQRVRLTFRLARHGNRHALVRARHKMSHGTRTFRLRVHRGRLGHRHPQRLRLTVTAHGRAGVQTRRHVTIHVR